MKNIDRVYEVEVVVRVQATAKTAAEALFQLQNLYEFSAKTYAFGRSGVDLKVICHSDPKKATGVRQVYPLEECGVGAEPADPIDRSIPCGSVAVPRSNPAALFADFVQQVGTELVHPDGWVPPAPAPHVPSPKKRRAAKRAPPTKKPTKKKAVRRGR